MSDEIIERVRALVEGHHGKVTGVWLEFEVRPDFAVSLLPQLQREKDCIPVMLGTETRLGPTMRTVNGNWVEIPPPCVPGAKQLTEQYPVHVYRIALPKKGKTK